MTTRPLDPEDSPELESTTLYAEPSAARGPGAPAEWALIRYVGNPLGEVLPLRGPEVAFGRASSSEICLPEPEVSRRHAVIHLKTDSDGMAGVFLEDLGSTNGTFLNGHRIVASGAPVRMAEGDVVRVGSQAFKLKQLDPLERSFHEAMLAQSTLDALTGVANRLSVLSLLEKQVDLARRYRRALSLVLVDLDHFKDVNDTRGHQAGDAVLKRFGALALNRLRGSDHVGRIGGEEFLIVLPETTGREGYRVAEALRESLASQPFEGETLGPEPLSVTASFGVAELQERDGSVGALLARADVALYRAKALGRNRVELDAAP
ncbi:MAG TPA: GGDEF domain-containing protein [Holophaga sp.]|nr:GGDEF domain-containing protein [Holophaga sp.]